MVKFYLGPFIQGQMRIATLKSVHDSLIIGSCVFLICEFCPLSVLLKSEGAMVTEW